MSTIATRLSRIEELLESIAPVRTVRVVCEKADDVPAARAEAVAAAPWAQEVITIITGVATPRAWQA